MSTVQVSRLAYYCSIVDPVRQGRLAGVESLHDLHEAGLDEDRETAGEALGPLLSCLGQRGHAVVPVQAVPLGLRSLELESSLVHSHWSRNVEAWFSLVESVAGASSLMP